ncbi:hypothetical protein HPO96_20825 [Kribbella sandramycini]|uniref:IrrE N-terminal-like domain-containing protein n=1 Tax=Kribbella sandramycini TaxID=60450 RepID=A0A7Y4P230_9ACTN|nr:ImmA/IrrE family metallo-endopeptidase [Kribbella sandramycini]MBB6566654.1 hypothetical protein [Kribbella sandramycini]NOL42694.1 hypothetical protein [Kribbella sandramycini]
MTKVAGVSGFGVRWAESEIAAVSWVDRRRRQIVLSPELGARDAAGRIAHELAHLRMHKLSSGSVCRGLVEFEAECVAYGVLARCGAVGDGVVPERLVASAAAVGLRPPARLVDAVGTRVVNAVGRIAGVVETHLGQSGEPVRDRSPRLHDDLTGTCREQGPDLVL